MLHPLASSLFQLLLVILAANLADMLSDDWTKIVAALKGRSKR